LFDAAVDGKDKDSERIPLHVIHSSPANGKMWCQALLDLSPGKHQVNIRSRCENGSQFFCGEQSATITIVVPAKPVPVVLENSKKAVPAATASLGVAAASPFVVPSFALPFHSTFLPVSDSLVPTDQSDLALPTKAVFAAPSSSATAASSPFPSSATIPQTAAAPWSTNNVWSDHATSLKPIQSNLSWNAPVDDNIDTIHPDDPTAKANLPSFFAAGSIVDFVLEDDDDISDTMGSSLFGFDEFLGATNDSRPSAAAATVPSSSFSMSSASPWGLTTAPASLPKAVPVTASIATSVATPAPGVTSPISPVSPSKTQPQGAPICGISIHALLQLACDATTWSPNDFSEGIRYIFQRLPTIEAATCAGSLRFACNRL
jgi:hypothetical protein